MISTGIVSRCLLVTVSLSFVVGTAHAQNPPALLPPPGSDGGTIHGLVKSGNMPIPGAAVFISLPSSDQKISVWSDVDGNYSAAVPSPGSYTVQVQMVAFANSSQQVVIDAAHKSVGANFELTLIQNPRAESSISKAQWRRSRSAWVSDPVCAAEPRTGRRWKHDDRRSALGDAASRS